MHQQMVWRTCDTVLGLVARACAVARSLLCGNRLSGTGLHAPSDAVRPVTGGAAVGYVRC